MSPPETAAVRRDVLAFWSIGSRSDFASLKGERARCPLQSGERHLRTGEGAIFGSVSRGDRTPLELFLAGVSGWEGNLRRLHDGTTYGS